MSKKGKLYFSWVELTVLCLLCNLIGFWGGWNAHPDLLEQCLEKLSPKVCTTLLKEDD